jgi:hypothetical protein
MCPQHNNKREGKKKKGKGNNIRYLNCAILLGGYVRSK